MSESFNALFNRLLRKAEAKSRKQSRRKPAGIYTGDTAMGRAIASGKGTDPGKRELDSRTDTHRGNWNVREYKQSPGAVKGRGKNGGIRK